MLSRSLRVALCVAGLGLAAHPAAAAVTVPGCEALQAWSATVDFANKDYPVVPALPVPEALSDANLTPVFGVPVLSWTKPDVQAAVKAVAVCWKQAKKARDAAALHAYKAGHQALAKTIPYILATVEKARAHATTLKGKLDAVPDSPELDRVLQAVLAGDPAGPKGDDFRGLPRDAVQPAYHLAQQMALLPPADRDPLLADLKAWRQRIHAAIGGEADKAIAAAGNDRTSVFALMQAAVDGGGNNPEADAKLAAKADAIRASLRQASPPAWVPPSCADLYRWAGKQEANARVPLGRYQIAAVFADDAVTPVFNLPLAAWTDDDLAAMKTLRGLCHKAWQALPDAEQVGNPPADAPELLKLASKGRWIDGAEQPLQQGRDLAMRYAAAAAAQQAALAAIKALPDTNEGLQKLMSMPQPTDLGMLDDAANKQYAMAVQAKRKAIGYKQYQAALDGLDKTAVDKLDELPKLVNYANQAMGTIADGNGRAAFQKAYERKLTGDINRLRPAFQAALDKMPVSLDGFAQTVDAVARLTKVNGTERAPAFRALHQAAAQRGAAIVDKLREANCKALQDELDMSGKEAAQPVWGPGKPITMGELVCRFANSGMAVSEYDGGGLFSSEQQLKVTMPLGGLQTITLHKAEVAAGQDEMLIGFKIADANQEKTMPVQQWEVLMHTTGEQLVTAKQCKPVRGVPEEKMKAMQRILALDCTLAASRGRLY